jgi:hypothetical protein
MPPEVAPDAKRIDMPQARVLLIQEVDDRDDDDDVLREQKERFNQMLEELVKNMEARGTIIRQESVSEDVGLYRYAEDGEFAGDTLHDNFHAASEQANWEYDQVLEWYEVPPSLKDATIDRKVIEKLLKSLPS